jgi:cytochrome c-type biogenesis protein CcmH
MSPHQRTHWRRLLLLPVALFALSSPVRAVTPGEMLKDPVLEARARAISQKLRCVVCQNQSIDDSNAPLAHDLRVLVRERLTNGDTDSEAASFIVARYGNFVLLQPPFQLDTLLLWAGPAIFLMGTALGFWRHFARYPAAAPAMSTFTPNEQERLDALLNSRSSP